MIKSVITLPNNSVKIEFEKTEGASRLVDAIVVSQSQYDVWSDADIESIIEKRWQDYLAATTPSLFQEEE